MQPFNEDSIVGTEPRPSREPCSIASCPPETSLKEGQSPGREGQPRSPPERGESSAPRGRSGVAAPGRWCASDRTSRVARPSPTASLSAGLPRPTARRLSAGGASCQSPPAAHLPRESSAWKRRLRPPGALNYKSQKAAGGPRTLPVYTSGARPLLPRLPGPCVEVPAFLLPADCF